MRVEAVTTFTEAGYEVHACKFLDSWERWGIPIHCYEEPLLLRRMEPYILEYDLEVESPPFVAFRDKYNLPLFRGRRANTYNYLFDAIKWSHRIFALAARARQSDADILVNIDSDIVVFDKIPNGFVQALLGDADIAYMPRPGMYSECSFVAYRMTDLVRDFIAEHERTYTSGMVFNLKSGWTDCHIFDVLLKVYERHDLKAVDINRGIPHSMHPFVNGPLGKYMDHMKGNRKHEGRSRKSDLVVKREEEYWQHA